MLFKSLINVKIIIRSLIILGGAKFDNFESKRGKDSSCFIFRN